MRSSACSFTTGFIRAWAVCGAAFRAERSGFRKTSKSIPKRIARKRFRASSRVLKSRKNGRTWRRKPDAATPFLRRSITRVSRCLILRKRITIHRKNTVAISRGNLSTLFAGTGCASGFIIPLSTGRIRNMITRFVRICVIRKDRLRGARAFPGVKSTTPFISII